MQVDNPLREDTKIYQPEKTRLIEHYGKRNVIDIRRRKQLIEINKTSSAIDFSNTGFDPNTTEPPKVVTSLNRKGSVQEPYVQTWKNTYDRVFSGKGSQVENYRIGRAQYLRQKETMGRNYNPITAADNSVRVTKQEVLDYEAMARRNSCN